MITHDYKLIFIHIPKCAGRSICNIFNQRFEHFTASYQHREYPHHWHLYDKFTIVRNPYSRLVSMYHYIQEHRRHSLEPVSANSTVKDPTFYEWVKLNLMANIGQFKFESPEGERGQDGQLGSRFWFSSQYRFLSTGSSLFKDIKIFKIEDGMDKVKDYLESKTQIPINIPTVNTSKHKPYQEYYTPELLDYLNEKEFITIDNEAFGYKFGD